jgi:hypothetical protein
MSQCADCGTYMHPFDASFFESCDACGAFLNRQFYRAFPVRSRRPRPEHHIRFTADTASSRPSHYWDFGSPDSAVRRSGRIVRRRSIVWRRFNRDSAIPLREL